MLGDTRTHERSTVHFDPVELREAWIGLQGRAAGTFFQTYEWHAAWARTAAAGAGETPLIVAVWDEQDELAAVLPFAIRSRFGQKTLVWMAQSASAYNMGLYRRDAAALIDPEQVFAAVRKADPAVSSVHLSGQPLTWDGLANPFAAVGQRMPSGALYGLVLPPSFEDLNGRFSGRRRNRHRRSQRKLEAAGVTFERIADRAGRLEAFREFVRQKSLQLRHRGSSNMYESPLIAGLYTHLLNDDATRDQFVVYAAKRGQTYLAVSIGVRHAGTYFDIMLSMDAGELEQLSPGFLMVSRVIENECEAGTGRFDFGPGLTELKSTWQAEPAQRFDTVLSLRASGLPAVGLHRARHALETRIRNQPTLLKAAKLLKRGLAGVSR